MADKKMIQKRFKASIKKYMKVIEKKKEMN